MSFERIFGEALSRTPINTGGAEPSIDMLSHALFADKVQEAKHNFLHRDMFGSMVEDDPLSVFRGDPLGEPLPGFGPSDVSVVEHLPERTPAQALDEILGADPSQELGLADLSGNQPSAQDFVRNMLRSS